MRLVNPSTLATKPVDNGFEGRTDGLTYTGTADDPQLLRVWGNILSVAPTTGMYSAILTDMSSGVTPTDKKKVTIADGAATMPATNGWWWNGILLAKGARDHTVHRMVQRRGLAGHASLERRLLRQGHGSILAIGLGVAA